MERDFSQIEVIGFDADDTIWINETYFRETEEKFAQMLSSYETPNKIDQELFKKEMENLPLFGYGIKGFLLSMIETAIELSNKKVSNSIIEEIIEMGKEMIAHPVELIDGIEEVLKTLSSRYRLLLLTKGDLLDQERKLERSQLSKYFHHVEVLSDKQPKNYADLLAHLEVPVSQFLMVGNSLKSDVLPLLEIGAKAVHIPFHTTWIHEQVEPDPEAKFLTLEKASELIPYLKKP